MFQRIPDGLAPDRFSTPGNYRVRSHPQWLLGENGCVNATHNHGGALRLCSSHGSVTGNAITAANTDADDVSRIYDIGVELLYGLINCRSSVSVSRCLLFSVTILPVRLKA